MLLDKTAKAREALQGGMEAGLSLADRRILILVDGKRSLDQLVSMLGADILAAADRLLREGYMERIDAGAPSRTPTLGSAVTGLIRATADVVQARAEQIRAASLAPATAIPAPAVTSSPPRADGTTAAPAAHPAGARRSLAACKMYMLDMLQLQRTPEAAELRAAIQCATDPALLVEALLQALRLIVSASTPSYGERVTQRLAEILPLEALPRLEALRAGRPAQPPSLSIVA